MVSLVQGILNGVLVLFGVVFWATMVFFVIYIIYRVIGPTPPMRARGLEELINWGINHITWIVAAVIILYIFTVALNILAGGNVISFATVLYDVVVKPIISGFHTIFG